LAAVRIENRAQLVYLLTEAAEIEHNVLCCYLFTQFSMKQDPSEGLTEAQFARVEEWRGVLRRIVVQEMLHLACACNLLTAVGGAPQLRRPNLPTNPRAYPAGFELRLMPFFLERPEYVDARAARSYRESLIPAGSLSEAFTRERDYATLGELYRGIEDGLKYLAQKLGEDGLFIGRVASQTASPFIHLPGLSPVHDLTSALEALNVIIEQGEGASSETEDSHYRRFAKMREQYSELLAADPAFQPGRPVLTSPYAMLPTDLPATAEVNVIDDRLSVDMCGLFDGCYELMVQILGRLFVHAEESEEELQALADIAIEMMIEVIEPLGSAITLLPAGRSHAGLNAGPSFRLSRGASIPTQSGTARTVFHERLTELSAYCQFLRTTPGTPDILGAVRGALNGFCDRLASSQP
jgi:Ferritin-like